MVRVGICSVARRGGREDEAAAGEDWASRPRAFSWVYPSSKAWGLFHKAAVRRALGGLAVLMWDIRMLLIGIRLTPLVGLLLSVLNPISYVLVSPFAYFIAHLHARIR